MAVRAGVLRSAEKAAELGGELGASSGEAPTQLTPTPVSVSRKVIATRTPAPSTPSVASGSPPSPFGKAHRNSTANLSWMERAALFEEQLGLARRPSVVIREEAPPPRDEPAPAEVPTPVAEAPRETPLSSEVDIPDCRPDRFGRAKLLAAFGVAVALVIGSMASRQFASRSEPAASTRSRPRPEPAPSLAAPTNAPTDTARALEPAPAAMALEPSETRVPSVTVDMLPKAPRHAGPRSKSKPNRR